MSARDWFVAPDGFDNPTLWQRNHERPDYPIALLVRVSSNAALFDGIVELLDLVVALVDLQLTHGSGRVGIPQGIIDPGAEGWRERWRTDTDRLEDQVEAIERERDELALCEQMNAKAADLAIERAELAESRARDLEAENARLRALLAEDVALLEELDAAWGGAGGAGL